MFACFMITDPKTAPKTDTARVAYGVAVGVLAALLVAPQRTEYASKVAVLASLVVVCAARPVIEALIARRRVAPGVVSAPYTAPKRRPRRAGVIVVAALVSVGVVAAGAYGADTPTHTRTGLSDQVASSQRRPGLVRIPQVPTASVAHDRLSDQIDEGTARAIANDVADDFVIQEEAERRRSVLLAIEVADRSHLQALLAEIRDHRTTSITVPDYDAEHLVVSVGLRPGQAAPAILTTTRVRVRDVTYDPKGKLVRATKWRSAVVTYEAWWSGEHYLLVSTVPPPGWHAPNV